MSASDRVTHWDQVERLELASRNLEERRLDVNILCARCIHGHVSRRRGQLHFEVFCSAIAQAVPSDLEECSGFSPQNTMDLDDMNKIALKIDARPPGVSDGAYL